jgi:AraC family transcriptional regulator
MKSMVPQLALGSSYGNEQQRRRISGILFTKRSFHPLLRTPRHSHENAFFYLVVEGAFREEYDRKLRFGTPSTVIFSPEDQPHADAWLDKEGTTFTVELAPSCLERLREYSPVLRTPRDISDGPIVNLAWRLYDEFHSADAVTPLALEGLALELLAACERRDPVCAGRPPRWLARVREALHDQFLADISLNMLAQIAGVHPTHLSRTFRRYLGCTVSDYLRDLRLQQAKRDLAASAMSLSDIALSAGYSDQSHFSTAFRRRTGLSPGEFRRQARR